MASDHQPTDRQRAALDALAKPPAHAGESKLRVFRQLPARQKPAYFRDHFLVPLLAAVLAVALVAFVAVRIAGRDRRPALSVAVVDGTLPLGAAAKLEEAYERRIGADVVIDDYFDTAKDGLTKLQTLLSDEQVDVIIATPDTFAQLASYGYLADLGSELPAAQWATLRADARDFAGFDDSDLADDVDDSGTGRGAALPYGLWLADAAGWHRYAGDGDALAGIAVNTRQPAAAQAFLDYLFDRSDG